MGLALVLFIVIILSLIWGRLRFFRMSGGTPTLLALAYDLAVGIQMLATLYFMWSGMQVPPLLYYFVSFIYVMSITLFWWAIFTAKKLDFAFSNNVGSIVTTGPFRIVRHPFYVSYMLAWIGNTLMFNSSILWITLLFLIAFYYISALKEERVIMKSVYSKEYEKYIQQVGMFLPRKFRWMPSSSEP